MEEEGFELEGEPMPFGANKYAHYHVVFMCLSTHHDDVSHGGKYKRMMDNGLKNKK